jgi:ABC-2 type transport system permease protein
VNAPTYERPPTLAVARRNAALVWRAAEYELRKAVAFRAGFLVREILRGLAIPLVTIFVFKAIFRDPAVSEIGGRSEHDLVAYLIMVAVLRKPLFHERGLDISEQIFEGYITKYLVMPFRFYLLALGRFVQFVVLQVPIAAVVWFAGRALFPGVWPEPVSATAVGMAALLVVLGSYCFFELTYVIHCLAFWLEVVWSLIVMSTFFTSFAGGAVLPVSVMPEVLQDALAWLFPYWSLHAPVELWTGHMGAADFRDGVLILMVWIAGLGCLRAAIWRRGSRRYTGGGM